MNDEFVNKYFLIPDVKLGYDVYVIRKSIVAAIGNLRGQIFGSVLDLGCGIMPYKEYLKESGKIDQYIGVDLQVSEYHNLVTPDLFWDGKHIPVEDKSQDWVIITEFLEHYFDTNFILNEIWRILKPGGKVFFTVPCIYVLHEVPYDYHRFTPFSILRHMENAQFIKPEIYPLGGINSSFLIAAGLWKRNTRVNKWVRKFISLFLLLFGPMLLKKNYNQDVFLEEENSYKNGSMPSGLWGYGIKGT